MSAGLRAATGAGIVVAGIALACGLAGPQQEVVATLMRVAADGAAVVVLGLAVVPMLDVARYRDELTGRATAALVAASAVWLVAELARLVASAAATAAVPITALGLRTTVEFALSTAAGRVDLICVAAAGVVGVLTVAARTASAGAVVAGVAAIGTAARTLSGHLAESPVGGVAVTVHALAAALWCGALAALVITIDHRGQWARVLPRFSALSLWCVAALVAGGTLSALVTLHSPAQLLTSGYGRLLSAKIVVTVALMVLAWRNRSAWLPSARAHRVTAAVSTRRSHIELALMTVALTLAAALAVTG